MQDSRYLLNRHAMIFIATRYPLTVRRMRVRRMDSDLGPAPDPVVPLRERVWMRKPRRDTAWADSGKNVKKVMLRAVSWGSPTTRGFPLRKASRMSMPLRANALVLSGRTKQESQKSSHLELVLWFYLQRTKWVYQSCLEYIEGIRANSGFCSWQGNIRIFRRIRHRLLKRIRMRIIF